MAAAALFKMADSPACVGSPSSPSSPPARHSLFGRRIALRRPRCSCCWPPESSGSTASLSSFSSSSSSSAVSVASPSGSPSPDPEREAIDDFSGAALPLKEKAEEAESVKEAERAAPHLFSPDSYPSPASSTTSPAFSAEEYSEPVLCSAPAKEDCPPTPKRRRKEEQQQEQQQARRRSPRCHVRAGVRRRGFEERFYLTDDERLAIRRLQREEAAEKKRREALAAAEAAAAAAAIHLEEPERESKALERSRCELEVESKALEASTDESEASEASTDESKALEACTAESKALETSKIESEALETSKIESEALEASKVESKALETSTAESKALETSTAESKALETSKIESKALEASTIETKALEASTAESKDSALTVIELKALEGSITESKALEASTAESKASALTVIETEALEASAIDLKALETCEDVGESSKDVESSGSSAVELASAFTSTPCDGKWKKAPGGSKRRLKRRKALQEPVMALRPRQVGRKVSDKDSRRRSKAFQMSMTLRERKSKALEASSKAKDEAEKKSNRKWAKAAAFAVEVEEEGDLCYFFRLPRRYTAQPPPPPVCPSASPAVHRLARPLEPPATLPARPPSSAWLLQTAHRIQVSRQQLRGPPAGSEGLCRWLSVRPVRKFAAPALYSQQPSRAGTSVEFAAPIPVGAAAGGASDLHELVDGLCLAESNPFLYSWEKSSWNTRAAFLNPVAPQKRSGATMAGRRRRLAGSEATGPELFMLW